MNESERSTRETIFRGASLEFSEFGFDGTSVRRIGKRADVDFTLINYHFGSKENLWKEVITKHLKQLSAFRVEFEKSEKAWTEGQKIRRHMKGSLYFATRASNKNALVILREIMGDTDRTKWLFEQINKNERESIFDLIPVAQANGEIGPGNPRLLYFSMILAARGLCINQQAYRFFVEEDPFSPELVDEMWAILDSIYFKDVVKAQP